MKDTLCWIFGLLLLVALMWLFAGNGLAMQAYFAPRQEAIRRTTFEQSKAYRDGMAQELRGMQFAYVQADDAHKAAIADLIRHRVAGFPRDALPSDLSTFIDTLQ